MSPQPSDEPERVPTQSELDAQDLAELEHRSADRDQANLFPTRPVDPGPPPRALLVDARVTFWGACACAVAIISYGIANLSTISYLLRQRLLEGSTAATDPRDRLSTDRIDHFANWLPIPMLIAIVVLLVIEYLFLIAIANHHSRHCRSFFLTIVVVNLLCVPIGLDLLFRYQELWSGVVVLGWLQFGLLLLSALMTLRRSVGTWLPASTRIRPSLMMRGRP